MTITADAGVLARSAGRSNGPAKRLIELVAASPVHKLALSEFILAEIGKTLAYSKLSEVLQMNPSEIHAFVSLLRRSAVLVEPSVGLPIVLSDPKDDPVIYTAVAAQADVLCARDRHFQAPNVLRFCQRHGIEVLDEIELLTKLERGA